MIYKAIGRWTLMVHLFYLVSCSQPAAEDKQDLTAQKTGQVQTNPDLISQVVEAYGGFPDTLHLVFDFREFHIVIDQRAGRYQYERHFVKEGDSIRDILTNEGLRRNVNGRDVKLTPKRAKAYSNSVNSVVYFALLPYRLQDGAVISKELDPMTISGKDYRVLQVSFKKEGGGEDHEDEFVYWFSKEGLQLDYFAYSYATDGGGIRFRVRSNTQELDNGLILQDYVNYKTDSLSTALIDLPELFEAGQLKEVSRIEIENPNLC